MAANTSPIYTNVPNVSWAKVSAADSSTDGTDADVVLVFTADATDGSFVTRLVFQPRSTSGSTTTSAAAGRIYINNGATVGTGTNNVLFKEILLPATAVNTGATAPAMGYEVSLNMQLPPSYRIYVGVTAVAANTNWDVCAVGGNY